ncbi:MAG: M20/M25/M40 family metallo-hydrolase [Candidatus Melainabacteria bacterium]|nr:M20/M25/M40 family metallo-hydrolase [Candidatus Melainabacteria bacterium]
MSTSANQFVVHTKGAQHPVLQQFIQLVPIANPSGKEDTLRQYVSNCLHALGLTQQSMDAMGNLLVRVPGNPSQPTLLLSAHLDSVPPCEGIQPVEDVHPHTRRSIIRSQGNTILGADDKAGIAVILHLAKQLAAENFAHNAPLELLFSVQEEIGLLGARALDTQQLVAKMGYALDGDGHAGLIFTAGASQRHLYIRCQGRAAHAGMDPEVGTNAIVMAATVCQALPQGRIADDTTANIGTIEGGQALNIVPDTATIRCEIRSHRYDALDRLVLQAEEVVAKAQYAFPNGQIHLEVLDRYPRFALVQEAPVIARAQKALRQTGLTPHTTPMAIGSDAHWLNHYGIETVVLGMGFYHSHSLGEYLDCDALVQMSQVVYRLVCAE